ncbi:MAG: TOBE domain-containing protein [Alphaproteobacteria bacterium]
MAEKSTQHSYLSGEIFLLNDAQQSFASQQVELLKAIDKCGSISQAAKYVGISYKTAWDRIDAMNNMSSEPLLIRSIGGAKGGGTKLTDMGKKIISGFHALQKEHQKFLAQLTQNKLYSLTDIANFIRNENMKSSARNQFNSKVTNITPGAVNAEVELDIGADQTLYAIITSDSVKNLELTKGSQAIALIKASAVIISKDTDIATSARNKLIGKVSRIVKGAVNSDITLDIGGEKSVCAIITNQSVENLALKEGDSAVALFKAPSVILLNS